MEKKITVYVVKTQDTQVTFGTRSKAAETVELLGKFGIQAELEQVKKTVTLD